MASHKPAIDLALSHGCPVALFLLSVLVAWLLIRSAQRGMAPERFSSGLVGGRRRWCWSRSMPDMPLYDSRINVVGWILMAGIRATFCSHHSRRSGEANGEASR